MQMKVLTVEIKLIFSLMRILMSFQVYKLLRLNFRGLSWKIEMVLVHFAIFESSVF